MNRMPVRSQCSDRDPAVRIARANTGPDKQVQSGLDPSYPEV